MTHCISSLSAYLGGGDKCVPEAAAHVLDVVRLTAAMARGEAAAIETFYRAYFDRLFGEARQASRRDEAFCLDVVQDAMLRIIRTIRLVESEAQLAAWLKLVVRTTAYDLMRSERRRRVREESAVGNQCCELVDPEQLDWLRGKLQQVDPRIAELIELRFERGWTLARIAGRLGLTTATVDGRLRRALERLRTAAREECHE